MYQSSDFRAAQDREVRSQEYADRQSSRERFSPAHAASEWLPWVNKYDLILAAKLFAIGGSWAAIIPAATTCRKNPLGSLA